MKVNGLESPRFKLIDIISVRRMVGDLNQPTAAYYKFVSLQEDGIILSVKADFDQFKTQVELKAWIREKLVKEYNRELNKLEEEKDMQLDIGTII